MTRQPTTPSLRCTQRRLSNKKHLPAARTHLQVAERALDQIVHDDERAVAFVRLQQLIALLLQCVCGGGGGGQERRQAGTCKALGACKASCWEEWLLV